MCIRDRLKITGESLKKLITDNHITVDELTNIELSNFRKPTDVIIGIVKCFSRGIAEEWVTEDVNIYKWMETNLGYERLQMGGQGGIIANALALLGVNQVIAPVSYTHLYRNKQSIPHIGDTIFFPTVCQQKNKTERCQNSQDFLSKKKSHKK